MKLTTVSVQDQDGRWQQLGAGSLRGVWPENVEITADVWGPRSLGFDLHRDPDVGWPDLQAYLRVEAQVAGVPVGQFRITDAPTRSADTVISVHCEGLQFHLDDDQYERVYVHANLSDWADQRSSLATVLGSVTGGFVAAPQVNADGGAITLQWPKDETIVKDRNVGVFLDLGPACTAARVVVTWEGSNADANNILYCRGTDDCNPTGGGDDAFTTAMLAGGPYTSRGTFATPRRYVHLLFDRATADATATSDCFFRITSVQVFADTAYESGDASILRGDHVVTDALDKATMLLSSDRSRVEQTSGFYLPEFAPDGPRTPRQAVEAVNVFFDQQCKVDEQGRMVYRARPTVPALKIGGWGSSEFEDASAASGEDVYSRVIVQGQDPVGQPVRAERFHAPSGVPVSPVIDNASADSAGTSGWSTGGTPNWTLARDTTVYDTAPGSIRFDKNAGAYPFQPQASFTGTFKAGQVYRLTGRIRASAAGDVRVILAGAANYTDERVVFAATTWTSFEAHWQPKADESGILALFYLGSATNTAAQVWLDSLKLETLTATVIERRGFRRTHTLDSGFALTTLSAQRLGDVFLAAHRTTPFKGRGQATGNGSVRDYLTGTPVGPERLLLHTGEPLHFDDRLDPDTGAVGRDGRLVQVTYKADTDTASFDIDSSRGDFDRTLQRAGVLVGQLR